MAIGAKRISPLDRQARIAVGVQIPFSSPSVFTTTYTTQEAIKTNLINYFLTNKNERPLNPEFGGNLRNYLFEQLNQLTTSELQAYIQDQLNINFPSISVDSLEVNAVPDINSLSIKLDYSISNTGVSDTLEITYL